MKFIMTIEEDGMLLRQFLREKLHFSSRFMKRLTAKKGYLLINNQPVTVRYILQVGDVLNIVLPEEKRSNSIQPEKIPLQIIYEDDWLIVLNKEAGIPSIPSRLHPTGTIANGLLAYYDEQKLPYTIHVVTRLDKDTSGLMLIAKHQYSHSLLSEMQRINKIKRGYEAIVHGVLQRKEGTINLPIRRKNDSIIEREVSSDGREAITHYKLINQYERYAHVAITLETGRTHQIRVHFSAIGHPLLGDDLYGGSTDHIKRQALHCSFLQFIHPFTKEQLTFKSKLPDEIDKLLIDA